MSIKIWFTDFWKNFNPEDNWFFHFLNTHFEIILNKERPDFIIYSKFGLDYLKYDCVRIFYTGENIRPNFYECDYALSFDFIERANHYRLPLYGINPQLSPEQLTAPKLPFEEMIQHKTEFCCFVNSSAFCKKRIDFFKKLSGYKFVHSGGKLLNNIGGPIEDKMSFISKFRFIIAFENSERNGYTTEKVFQPMFTNTIPIYWGNPSISRDFNTASFINMYDFDNDDQVIERILQLENNLTSYKELYNKTWFNNNEVNQFVNRENIRLFFQKVFNSIVVQKKANSFVYSHLGLIKRKGEGLIKKAKKII